MENVVVAFPGLAAWLIVGIGALLVGIVSYGGRQVLQRLDTQDNALEAIRSLLASEVHKLREMQHAIELRVTRIESACAWIHRNHGDGVS